MLSAGYSQYVQRQCIDLSAQDFQLCGGGFARFGQHHQALSARGRIRAAEDRNAPLADAGNIAHSFLKFIGVDISPGADDDVLCTAGQVDIAFGQIGKIAGIQPLAMEQLACLLRVAEVAAGGGRPLEFEMPFHTLPQLASGGIHDPDLVAGKRLATCHIAQGIHLPAASRFSMTGTHEPVPLDASRSAVRVRVAETPAQPNIRPAHIPARSLPGAIRSGRSVARNW